MHKKLDLVLVLVLVCNKNCRICFSSKNMMTDGGLMDNQRHLATQASSMDQACHLCQSLSSDGLSSGQIRPSQKPLLELDWQMKIWRIALVHSIGASIWRIIMT